MMPHKLRIWVTISTPLGKNLNIGGLELSVDLMTLELYDFDLILGMDSLNKAQVDCFTNNDYPGSRQ